MANTVGLLGPSATAKISYRAEAFRSGGSWAPQPHRGWSPETVIGQPVPVVGTLQTETLVHGGLVEADAFDRRQRHVLIPLEQRKTRRDAPEDAEYQPAG